MSFYSRLKSFIFRLDNLKIKKSKPLLKIIYFFIFKAVNFARWILAFKTIGEVKSLNEFYKKLNIYWYGGNEGHTQQVPEEAEFLFKSASNLKNILEVGFNGGHSSETFLNSSSNAIIESVDIGFHHYVKFGSFYLKKKYPGRFFLHIGKSKDILPKIIKQKNIFDLIFIDGSHEYRDVFLDIKNGIELSHASTLIILDDVYYPKNNSHKENFDSHNMGPTKAWLEFIDSGKIKEINYKEFATNNTNKRSLVVGKSIK